MRMGSSHDPNPQFFFPLKRRGRETKSKTFLRRRRKIAGYDFFPNILGILVNYEANSMEIA